MSSWDNLPALPGVKSDLKPPATLPANTWASADINPTVQAIADLRTAVQSLSTAAGALAAQTAVINDSIHAAGFLITAQTTGGMGAGQVVGIAGYTTVNGVRIPTISPLAANTVAGTKAIGILTQTVSGVQTVAVRLAGELQEVALNTSGRSIGDLVYLQDNGTLGFTSGTFTVVVGYVSFVGSSGAMHVQIKNDPSGAHRINVKDYGAKGDGATDDTAAINLAFTAASNREIEILDIGGALASFSAPDVYFPEGEYHITATLSPVLTMRGARAVIRQMNASLSILSGFSSDGPWTIEGMGFRGGKDQINVNTGPIDGININITSCDFQGWDDGAALKVNAIGGTTMVVSNSQFIPSTNNLLSTLCVVNAISCDELVLKDSTVLSPINGDCFISGIYQNNETGAVINATNLNMAPGGSWTTGPSPWPLPVWWRIYGGILRVENCRHGGEGGARPVVANHQTGSTIKITRSACFTALSNSLAIANATYIMYALPQELILKENQGDGLGTWLDTAITATDIQAMVTTGDAVIDGQIYGMSPGFGGEPASRFGTISDSAASMDTADAAQRTVMFGLHAARVAKPLLVTDLVRVVQDANNTNDYNKNGGGIGGSSTFGSNIFGTPTRTNFFVTPGSTNEVFNTLTDALKHLPAGTYTVVFDITVNTNHVELFSLAVGHAQWGVSLEPGRHLVSRVVNLGSWETSNVVSYFWGSGVFASSTTLGPIKIYQGRVTDDQLNSNLWGTSAPTSGMWFPGDVVNNAQPVPGGNMGWVCTTSGGAYGSTWAQNTTYTAGQYVLNSNNGAVFQCVVGGQSASSGNGPSNSNYIGIDIADNTATWWLVAYNAAVFRSFGAISLV